MASVSAGAGALPIAPGAQAKGRWTHAAALADIGYRVGDEGALDPALATVLRAFQRRWRPEAVTGQADSGTLARLLAVAQMVTGG